MGYFRRADFEKQMQGHFEGQNRQVRGLKTEVEQFGQRLAKLTIVIESLVKHEFYKKKYLECETNLSKSDES